MSHYFYDFTHFRELGQKYKNIFVQFLVQMKTSKFAFEINWPLMRPPFKSISNTLHRLKGSKRNIKILILCTFQQKSFDCIPLQFIVDSKTRTNFKKITFRILKPGRALPQFLGNCIKQSLSGRPNSRALCVAR